MKRIAGAPPPWTDDPVLASHRFTNVYRASDRVSQYLIRNVIYEGRQTGEEIFFRTLLFKLFNKIETWKGLESKLGPLAWKTFDYEKYAAVLDGRKKAKQPIYNTAYRLGKIPPPMHRYHLRLLEQMMHEHAPSRVERAKSLREVLK